MSKLLYPSHPSDPSQESASLPLSWNHLHDLSGNNPEFELELLGIFVEDTQGHLDVLKQALALQDLPTIAQEAHHIKGASANVGAVPMQLAASTLEQQAKLGTLENVDQLFQEQQDFLDRIRAYLNHQLS